MTPSDAAATQHRDTVPTEDQWDMSPLFTDPDQWADALGQLEADRPKLAAYKDRLSDGIDMLASALADYFDLMRRADAVTVYARQLSDQDRTNSQWLGMRQQADQFQTRLAQAAGYLAPEILAIPTDVLTPWLDDPKLSAYRRYVSRILRHRPHTLDAQGEELLAMSRDMANAAGTIFGQLNDADFDFGILEDSDGTETPLTHGTFISWLHRPNRDLRRQAFDQFYTTYHQHRHTLTAALAGSVQRDWFFARARRHPSCRSAALFGNHVPETVYDALVETVRANLTPVHTYLDYRRRCLGLNDLHIYDTYVPIVTDSDDWLAYEDAVDVCMDALAPLGNTYGRVLRHGLMSGWVDRYENRGKRSGAYSSGCYDSPPYILLNYDPSRIDSLFTLAHEAGHSMHTWLANTHQPYPNADYSIFVAEVASTVNEMLLTRYLLSQYRTSPKRQAAVLNRLVDAFRATLVRQTMFAEFEQVIHSLAETDAPLTIDTFTTEYRHLLDIYFGEAMVVDPRLELECLRIPHFYHAFYVYQYATGISAAAAIAERLATGDREARRRYLEFLAIGGSRDPIDALGVAGVDMTSPEPVQQAMKQMGDAAATLEQRHPASPGDNVATTA